MASFNASFSKPYINFRLNVTLSWNGSRLLCLFRCPLQRGAFAFLVCQQFILQIRAQNLTSLHTAKGNGPMAGMYYPSINKKWFVTQATREKNTFAYLHDSTVLLQAGLETETAQFEIQRWRAKKVQVLTNIKLPKLNGETWIKSTLNKYPVIKKASIHKCHFQMSPIVASSEKTRLFAP